MFSDIFPFITRLWLKRNEINPLTFICCLFLSCLEIMMYRLHKYWVTTNCVQTNLKVCICSSRILSSGLSQMIVTGELPAVGLCIAVALTGQECRTSCARLCPLKGMRLSKEFRTCSQSRIRIRYKLHIKLWKNFRDPENHFVTYPSQISAQTWDRHVACTGGKINV